MKLSAERLEAEILRLPWRVLLSEPVVVRRETSPPPESAVLAAIPLLGTWSGWLTLRCDVRIIREIAVRMRESEPAQGPDLDEAARWLVAAIAEAAQCVIDPSAKLGSPSVLDGTVSWAPPSCRIAARLRLCSGERAMVVTLSERVPVGVRRTGAFPSDLETLAVPEELAAGDAEGGVTLADD